MERPSLAYKVLTSDQMAALERDGIFAGAPIDLADGYIHLSTATQLDETVAKHFAGQGELHVAAVDLAALGDAVKWEPSRGGDLFPHVYAPLPLSAVIAYGPLERGDDGRIKFASGGLTDPVAKPGGDVILGEFAGSQSLHHHCGFGFVKLQNYIIKP